MVAPGSEAKDPGKVSKLSTTTHHGFMDHNQSRTIMDWKRYCCTSWV